MTRMGECISKYRILMGTTFGKYLLGRRKFQETTSGPWPTFASFGVTCTEPSGSGRILLET